MSKRYFITGTGTDVGKTVASVCLCLKLGATYWKPVQSGPVKDYDFLRIWGVGVHPTLYDFKEPLSPHAAARLEGKSIDLKAIKQACPTKIPLVIEGAGGVLSPIGERSLNVDLIQALEAEPIVVASSGLGTINHTLMTLEALRARGLEPLGVILNGEPNASNRQAIEDFGKVQVLGEIPRCDSFSKSWFLKALDWPKEETDAPLTYA